MELYYSWYSISSLLLPTFCFGFKDHDLYRFVWFFAILQIWYESCMYIKRKKEQIWKCVWNTNELIDNRMENMIIMFLSNKFWFTMQHFLSWIYMFRHAFLPPSFSAICTHLKCYKTSDVQLTLLCGTKQLKKIGLEFQVFVTLASSMMYHMRLVKTISWPSQIMIWN
jgi:hypothetical protein